MAKKRGLDMKLYRMVAALSVAPTQTPASTSYLEVTTVNKVSKKFSSTQTTIETRESADDIVLASGRDSEFTVAIPVDLADPHYIALAKASANQTQVHLCFAVNALTTADAINDVQIGNFSVTDESSDEEKKNGVIATFTCKPGDGLYRRIIKDT